MKISACAYRRPTWEKVCSAHGMSIAYFHFHGMRHCTGCDLDATVTLIELMVLGDCWSTVGALEGENLDERDFWENGESDMNS